MRISEMITKRNILDVLTYSPNKKFTKCIDNSQENLMMILGLRELIASF